MTTDPIRILLVDDDEDFHVLMARWLKDASAPSVFFTGARDRDSAIQAALSGNHDLLLVDYFLAQETGLDLLRDLRSRGCDLPFVLLTGHADPALDQQALEAGASDYLEKSSLDPRILLRSIRYAAGRHRVLLALKRSERIYRSLMGQSTDAIFIADLSMNILELNDNACRLQGYPREEALKVNIIRDLCDPQDLAAHPIRMEEMLSGRVVTSKRRLRRRDGSWFTAEITIRLVDGNRFQGIIRDVTERRTAEQKLKESEQFYRLLLENSQDAALIVGPDHRIVYEAPSNQKILGREPGEMVGKPAFTHMHPDDLPRVMRTFESILQEPGASATGEMRMQHSDGTWRWVEGTARNLMHHPLIRGVVINYRDITDRKSAEERLRESEQYYRLLMENSRDVALIIGPDRTITYEAPSTRQVLGRQPGQMIGQNAFVNVHPDDRSLLIGSFQKVVSNPSETVTLEFRMRHSDGSWRWIEGNARYLLAHPLIRGVVINYRDITERREAEEALRASERYYRALIENALDVIVVFDAEGTILYETPSIRKVLGYSPEERRGQSILGLVHPEELEQARRLMRDLFDHPGQVVHSRFRLRHRDGQWRTIEGVGANLLSDPSVRGIVLNYRDVTEAVQAQDRILRYERLATLGEITAGLAHEIRNPLATILSTTQYLKSKPELAALAPQLEPILEQSERIRQLVNETLDYSKNPTLHLEPVSAAPLIGRALMLARTQFGPDHAKTRVELSIPDDLPPVPADRRRLEQALVNLILNAYQALAPEGGEITLSCGIIGGEIQLRVRDNGPGLRDEIFPKIFEPFFTTKRHGSGLGLSICQRMAREHNGRVTVERLKPRGTQFTIHLPLDGSLSA